MSYTIIFDTKFIKLNDGRLLHLDRSGCNNDTAGRNLTDYTGKIYTKTELTELANSYMKDGKTDDFDMKIRSKPSSFYDYGKHLLRMAKKAETYNDFCSERWVTAKRYDGVKLLSPEVKTLSRKEFSDCFYDLLYGCKSYSYIRILTPLESESEIVEALENKDPVQFYVEKKPKYMTA